MKGHLMRVLFVKGEVTSSSETSEGTHCLVNITNDGWHVCARSFFATDTNDLETQFYGYLETEEFQDKLHVRQ